MSIQRAWQFTFDFLGNKPVVVEPGETQLSSDAGLLPIRQFDEQIGLTAQFADALDDPRDASATHSVVEMVRSRIFGILADYPDQNDHDTLRDDPVFKLIAGRQPDDDPLASQPTLSRFENSVPVRSFFRLQDVFIDQFIASFDKPPRRITLDVDTFDDPAHGEQQLTFFHGHYGQRQYLPRVITCAETDQVVMVCLLFGTANPALGFVTDLKYLAERLRAVWPDVEIRVRADSGFAMPQVYDGCESLQVTYSIGLKMNPILQKRSEALQKQALEQYERSGEPQRLFTGFWYQAGSWPAPRWVVIKAEANAQGTNRRAMVTNRPGAQVLPQPAYDEYADRGESENRNKELKCGLHADRLSDHRYFANLFRLYLHAATNNLLVRLRRVVADPPPENAEATVPREALGGKERQTFFNRRRERDPLGEGQPCTWRTRLIKVAAEISVSVRRVVVRLAGCWPYLNHYRHVVETLSALSPAVPPAPD